MSLSSDRPAGVPFVLLLSVVIGSISLFSLVKGGLQAFGFNSTSYPSANLGLTMNAESLEARLQQAENELQQVKQSEKQKNDALWDANTQLAQTQQALSAKEQELATANQQIQAFQTELTNKTQEIESLNGSIAQLTGENQLLATCISDVNDLISSIDQLNLLSAPGRLYNLVNSFTLREGACSRASVLIPNILVVDLGISNPVTNEPPQPQTRDGFQFRMVPTVQANIDFSPRVSQSAQPIPHPHFRQPRRIRRR